MQTLILYFSLFFALGALAKANAQSVFVDVTTLNPKIQVELRYFSTWNFLGHPVEGYHTNKCLLTQKAAQALSAVQNDVQASGYTLLAFDCYRPQRAVTEFVHWTQDPKDQKMRGVFYPNEPKNLLLARGYIAPLSGHSRGSTLDLTLIRTDAIGQVSSSGAEGSLRFQEAFVDCRKQDHIESTGQLDMGTSFDCFDHLANTNDGGILARARKNRDILKSAMQKQGFVNYSKEWWHFTLQNEPYQNDYFDFVIE